MGDYTYYVDGFELLYRVDADGTAYMWKAVEGVWSATGFNKEWTEAHDIERGMSAWTVYTGPMPDGLDTKDRIRYNASLPATKRGVCTHTWHDEVNGAHVECGRPAVATWGISFGGTVALQEEGRCLIHWD